MRIWHKKLIPKLCQKHLCAVWRESLGCYKIITHNKQGYRHHPATQEFINCPQALHARLALIKAEATKRGYHFKELPPHVSFKGKVKEWQSLATQKAVLKDKGCKCEII